MIPPSELRIGNWVVRKTFDVGKQIIQLSSGSDIDNYANYFPIPITHELLKKCGFETIDYEIDVIDWARKDTERQFSISQNGIPVENKPYVFDYENGFGDDIEIEITSLNQLQNLYFFITGKELEYLP